MEILQIRQYWATKKEVMHTYKTSQLNNPLLSQETIHFLISCGLPKSCAPGLSFDDFGKDSILTPNQVLNIDINELNNYLMIGNNGCGDPICIDVNNDNNIVYLNHDNYFERIFINSSIQQLTECIIKYEEFYASLEPKIENNIFITRKFSDKEFNEVCKNFQQIDDKCLINNNCWKAELDFLVWERDNE